MSLHHLAKEVQSKGRGRDTMLVHMSPREVAGLQALAMAHGGKLSINPDTGLPEAGFLEQVLPVVAAGALTYFTAGAATPILGEALAGTALAGSQGLLAGAGIGALVGGGMSALQGGNFGRGALMGGLGGAIAGGLGAFGGPSPFDVPTTPTVPEVPVAPGAPAPVPTAAAPTPTPTPDVSNVYSGLAGQPTVAPGTMPPLTPAPTDVGAMDIGFGPGRFTPTYTASDVTGMSPSQFARFSGQGGVGTGLFGTNITAGQAALGLGGLGLVGSLSDRSKYGIPPLQTQTSTAGRLSPEFRGYEPQRPNPYYRAQYPVYGASGGVVALADGGPVERMSAMSQQPGMYPQGMIDKTYYATPSQRPASMEVVRSDYDTPVNPITGIGPQFAKGGISDLGGYSDGGRLLRGPGDGVSDDIPAQIGARQPARLADGEFVVPARIVSEIGNGSTDAGARKLYAMMDRVQNARRKSMKKGKFAVDSKAEKLLPA